MALKLKRRAKIWHMSGTVRGIQVRESTGCTDKSAAHVVMARRQHEIETAENPRETGSKKPITTWGEICDLYALKMNNLSYSTNVAFNRMRRFIDPKTPIKDIRPAFIADLRRHPLAAKMSDTSFKNVVQAYISAVHNYAVSLELADPIKIPWVESAKTKRASYPDDVWLATFLDKCDDQELTTLMLFISFTGARVGEALTVTWESLNLSACKVPIVMKKTGTQRTAHIPPVLESALRDWQRVRGTWGGLVFPTWSTSSAAGIALRRSLARLNLTPYTSHVIGRHMFASRLLNSGASLKVVAEAGGWANTRMVDTIYGHVSKDVVESVVKSVGHSLPNVQDAVPMPMTKPLTKKA